MRVRVSRPLRRNPNVLLDADAELDLDFVVVLVLLHQPDNVCMVFGVGLVECIGSGKQIGHFPGCILCNILLFSILALVSSIRRWEFSGFSLYYSLRHSQC